MVRSSNSAQRLGAHNREIQRDILGLDNEAISEVANAGVLLSGEN